MRAPASPAGGSHISVPLLILTHFNEKTARQLEAVRAGSVLVLILVVAGSTPATC
jgi:hypothetical protein